jgi:hypothetical protein
MPNDWPSLVVLYYIMGAFIVINLQMQHTWRTKGLRLFIVQFAFATSWLPVFIFLIIMRVHSWFRRY